jgi:hypothetical protein
MNEAEKFEELLGLPIVVITGAMRVTRAHPIFFPALSKITHH